VAIGASDKVNFSNSSCSLLDEGCSVAKACTVYNPTLALRREMLWLALEKQRTEFAGTPFVRRALDDVHALLPGFQGV
jgi:hypothetical protein